MDKRPDMLIGFASVDPHRSDAVEVLERAFTGLQLTGLKTEPGQAEVLSGWQDDVADLWKMSGAQ